MVHMGASLTQSSAALAANAIEAHGDDLDRLELVSQQYKSVASWADGEAIEVVLGVLRSAKVFALALGQEVETKGLGLSRSRYMVLRTLYFSDEKELAQHQVGKAIGISRMAVTKLVAGLEKDGLVTRVAHPRDRRVILTRLTPEGEALTIDLLPVVASFMAKVCEGFNEEEKVAFKQFLRRFYQDVSSGGAR